MTEKKMTIQRKSPKTEVKKSKMIWKKSPNRGEESDDKVHNQRQRK